MVRNIDSSHTKVHTSVTYILLLNFNLIEKINAEKFITDRKETGVLFVIKIPTGCKNASLVTVMSPEQTKTVPEIIIKPYSLFTYKEPSMTHRRRRSSTVYQNIRIVTVELERDIEAEPDRISKMNTKSSMFSFMG